MPAGLGLGELAAAAACGGILQGLCRPVSECRCACHFEQGPDHSILELLREQLQRCGPEHLTVPAPSSVECPDLGVLLSATALLFLCLGILISFGIQAVLPLDLYALFTRRAQPSPRTPKSGGRGVIVVDPARA